MHQNYEFYRKLNPKFKKAFEHRVAKFINKYKIIGRQDFIVNEEVKTLIAGCYVQLTFGMNDFITSGFKRILVYNSSYFSNISKKNHIGEFNPQFEIIVFSWVDFLKGIRINDDNYNLGIYEFSHAILFESINSANKYEYDFSNKYYTSFTGFGLLKI